MMVYRLFAKVLDYPRAETCAEVEDLVRQVSAESPEAAALLEEFHAACATKTVGELEELYTSTFDMRPDCTTNLGHHLFGDDIRRNLFMAQLKERQERRRIAAGAELPDHLSLVLELLAAEDSAGEAQTLIADCLAPGIHRMLKTFNPSGGDNPYGKALRALWLVLRQHAGMEAPTAEPSAV